MIFFYNRQSVEQIFQLHLTHTHTLTSMPSIQHSIFVLVRNVSLHLRFGCINAFSTVKWKLEHFLTAFTPVDFNMKGEKNCTSYPSAHFLSRFLSWAIRAPYSHSNAMKNADWCTKMHIAPFCHSSNRLSKMICAPTASFQYQQAAIMCDKTMRTETNELQA